MLLGAVCAAHYVTAMVSSHEFVVGVDAEHSDTDIAARFAAGAASITTIVDGIARTEIPHGLRPG